MKTSRSIMAFVFVAVLGIFLAVSYSSNRSSRQAQQAFHQLTSLQNQTGSSKDIGSKEPQGQSTDEVIWLPNQRIQTIRKDRMDVVFIDSNHGWKIVPGQGAMNSEPADIDQTTDGGRTWIKIAVANQKNVSASESANLPAGTLPYEGIKNGLSFVSSSTGWITGYTPRAGYQWIFVTNDGGHTWLHQELPVPKDVSHYTSMSFDLAPPTFFTSKDGILIEKIADASEKETHPTYVFLFTQDGGKNWGRQPPLKAVALNFPDTDPERLGQSFTVTVNNTTWRTSDGGYNWIK